MNSPPPDQTHRKRRGSQTTSARSAERGRTASGPADHPPRVLPRSDGMVEPPGSSEVIPAVGKALSLRAPRSSRPPA
jgi:hypothetical protein